MSCLLRSSGMILSCWFNELPVFQRTTFFHLQGPRSLSRRFSLCIFLHFPLTPLSYVKIFSTVDCCHTLSIYMRTEVLAVVTMKIVFWSVIPLNVGEVYQCLKGSGCLYTKSHALMRKEQFLWKCWYTPGDYKV